MSRPEPVFLVQDIWTLHSERYCDECPYRQTHISFVPYGEGSTELVDETCALLNDVNIPETECLAWEDWHKDEEIDDE